MSNTHVVSLFTNSSALVAAKSVTVATIGIFTGMALSYNAVIIPSLRSVPPENALPVWAHSYKIAKKIQVSLILTSIVAGSTVYYKTENPYFLAGPAIMASIIPYTFGLLLPINKSLLAISSSGKGEEKITELFNRWDALHAGRTLMSIVALGLVLYGGLSGKSLVVHN
ncbi:hypothetical protein BGX28_002380 [Mortierella sp. GBA30]|nr:hypothetical protein BGX28_002380 [Mortierella sp. GBA30]